MSALSAPLSFLFLPPFPSSPFCLLLPSSFPSLFLSASASCMLWDERANYSCCHYLCPLSCVLIHRHKHSYHDCLSSPWKPWLIGKRSHLFFSIAWTLQRRLCQSQGKVATPMHQSLGRPLRLPVTQRVTFTPAVSTLACGLGWWTSLAPITFTLSSTTNSRALESIWLMCCRLTLFMQFYPNILCKEILCRSLTLREYGLYLHPLFIFQKS